MWSFAGTYSEEIVIRKKLELAKGVKAYQFLANYEPAENQI